MPCTSLSVNRLRLTNFRSYAQLDLRTEASLVVLVGPNGAGKTNILESISLLTPGRGMRRATLAEMARNSENTADEVNQDWAIHAQVNGLLGPAAIGTGVQDGHRVVRIDGETASGSGALGKHLSALWLTPVMDRLFAEGASNRRRFFDRMVFGLTPGHGAESAAYEKALRDRSRLLKERSEKTDWLNILENRMAIHGVAIADARLKAMKELQSAIDDHLNSVFPRARLTLQGSIEDVLLSGMSVEDAVAYFNEQLKTRRARDSDSGGASIGPHKTDLVVYHVETGHVATQCSTGQQKALLINTILANMRCQMMRRNVGPILLLDEVAAHMDHCRRDALFSEVQNIGGQVWLTGTDREFFKGLEPHADFYTVQESAIMC